MTKTTRNQRRKRKLSSPAAAGHGGAKAQSKKLASSASGKHTTTVSAGGIAVKGGRAVKRPTPRAQAKATKKASASGRNGADGGKKRPRSEVQPEEEEEEEQEEEGRPQIVDELVATIQHHDEFFSRMLDMIPEHLVLPAKEVAESSYASKYMKVRYRCEIVRVSGATDPCLEKSGSVMLASVEGYFALTLFCDGVPRPLTGEPLTASRFALRVLVLAAFPLYMDSNYRTVIVHTTL